MALPYDITLDDIRISNVHMIAKKALGKYTKELRMLASLEHLSWLDILQVIVSPSHHNGC